MEYIKKYHFTSVEYHQKLVFLNATYKNKIFEISKIINEKVDFSLIFDFVNTIGSEEGDIVLADGTVKKLGEIKPDWDNIGKKYDVFIMTFYI